MKTRHGDDFGFERIFRPIVPARWALGTLLACALAMVAAIVGWSLPGTLDLEVGVAAIALLGWGRFRAALLVIPLVALAIAPIRVGAHNAITHDGTAYRIRVIAQVEDLTAEIQARKRSAFIGIDSRTSRASVRSVRYTATSSISGDHDGRDRRAARL